MARADDELLGAIARLYDGLDPAPPDLADGVLARLAVVDLEREYELLTLVERIDLATGTRSAEAAVHGDTATVALEFAGTSYRVLVRISSVEGERRVDGWVVPAVPMRVFLGPPDDARAHARQRADADNDGRFEFDDPPAGEMCLWLLPESADDTPAAAPFVTPPFTV